MTITSLGVLLIPLAVCAALLSNRWLVALTIFFIPFSASAVVNVQTLGSGVQPVFVFGGIWILKYYLTPSAASKTIFLRSTSAPAGAWLCFVLIATVSLLMPLHFSNGFHLPYSGVALNVGDHPQTSFSLHHVTQVLYLWFGVLFALLLATTQRSEPKFTRALRVYVVAVLFVSCWGWLQWALYQLHLPYPLFFNANISGSAMGYEQTYQTFTRVSSVATEPSTLAMFLLTAIPLLASFVVFRTPLLSRRWDRVILCVALSAVVISTSASGLIGLFVILVTGAVALTAVHALRMRYVALMWALVVGVCVVYVSSEAMQNAVDVMLFDKASSYSGLERMATVGLSWEYFKRFPILGLGWGSLTSHDLIVEILANVGILGFIAFVLAIGFIYVRIIRIRRCLSDTRMKALWVGTLTSLTTILVVSVITGFPFTFVYFWFVIGISICVPGIVYQRLKCHDVAKAGGHLQFGTRAESAVYR